MAKENSGGAQFISSNNIHFSGTESIHARPSERIQALAASGDNFFRLKTCVLCTSLVASCRPCSKVLNSGRGSQMVPKFWNGLKKSWFCLLKSQFHHQHDRTKFFAPSFMPRLKLGKLIKLKFQAWNLILVGTALLAYKWTWSKWDPAVTTRSDDFLLSTISSLLNWMPGTWYKWPWSIWGWMPRLPRHHIHTDLSDHQQQPSKCLTSYHYVSWLDLKICLPAVVRQHLCGLGQIWTNDSY